MFPILDSLDSIEESDRKFFEKTDDDKYQFNRSKFEAAIKTPLITKRDELLGKLTKYKDFDDTDLARIAKLKAKGEKLSAFDEWIDAQDDDPANPGKGGKADEKTIRAAVKAEVERITNAHSLTLKQKDDAIAELNQKFESRELDLALDALALEHGVIAKRLPTWKAAIRSRFAREDGELVYLENGKASIEITPEKAVRDLLFKEFDYLYEAREAGGGSGKGNKTSGKPGSVTKTRAQFEKLNPSEASAFMAKVRKGEASLVD